MALHRCFALAPPVTLVSVALLLLSCLFPVATRAQTPSSASASSFVAQQVQSLAQWSSPFNGLSARVAYVDPHGFNGFVVLIELRNVGSRIVMVPAGNSPDRSNFQPFTLQVQDWKGVWRIVAWEEEASSTSATKASDEVAEGTLGDAAWHAESNGSMRTPVLLAPGESILIWLRGDRSSAEAPQWWPVIRVVLNMATPPLTMVGPSSAQGKIRSAATAPVWTGVLETPPFPVRLALKLQGQRRGSLELPQHLPAFSHALPHPLLRDLFSEGVSGLLQKNDALSKALELYSPISLKDLVERKMSETSDTRVKLMLARAAARSGSERAVGFLQGCVQERSFTVVRDVHTVLGYLLEDYGKECPSWLISMVERAILDEGELVQDNPSRGHMDGCKTISQLAYHEGRLPGILGATQCPGAFDTLVKYTRAYPGQTGPERLADLGDPRAVPFLMELLRKVSGTPDGNGGVNLSSLATALAAFDAKDAVPLLSRQARSIPVIVALGRLGGPVAEGVLQKKLGDLSDIVSAGISYSDEEKTLILRTSLAATDPKVRAVRFEELLGDSTVRRFARPSIVAEMSELRDASLAPLLRDLVVRDSNNWVVRNAVQALGELRDKGSVPVLIASFQRTFDSDDTPSKGSYTTREHRGIVAQVLEKITDQDWGPEPEAWQAWWEKQQQSPKN